MNRWVLEFHEAMHRAVFLNTVTPYLDGTTYRLSKRYDALCIYLLTQIAKGAE